MHDIVIDNISKSFGAVKVFDGFSAVLQAGRIYRLTAPSGAGKTTLLRMLMKLEKPDGGSIRGIPKGISAVFQEDRLLEELSIYDNIAIAADMPMRSDKFNRHTAKARGKELLMRRDAHGSQSGCRDAHGSENAYAVNVRQGSSDVYAADAQKDRIMTSLTELGLAEYADRPVMELSGGMKRRAALIRAMLHASELVLLDEPFTGLDDEARSRAARYLLDTLNGRTCVIASHIIDPDIEACSELIDI